MELAEKDRPPWLKRFQPFEDDALLSVRLRESKPVAALPERLKNRVIFNHHLSYYVGHFGLHKTLRPFKLNFTATYEATREGIHCSLHFRLTHKLKLAVRG